MNKPLVGQGRLPWPYNLLSRRLHRRYLVRRRYLRLHGFPAYYSLILPPRISQSDVRRHILRIARWSRKGYQLKFLSGPVEITDDMGMVVWTRRCGELSECQKLKRLLIVCASECPYAQRSFCAADPQVFPNANS